MALPSEFLQELIYKSDITEIVSSYVNVKRRGRNLVGLCPFHSEKTPSFNVYTETNSYYCFGCGAGGDVVNFTMRIEMLDYIEAVKLLAQKAGLSMPDDAYDDSMANFKKRIYEANRVAARFFYSKLKEKEGQAALQYLHQKRALSFETIRNFGLGFSPDSRFALSNHLQRAGFTNSEIVAANLGYLSKNGNSVLDRFYNRVMFPILDLRGNIIAFGGRIMSDQKPKYLNTSDTPVFKKSENLFSLNNAKNFGKRAFILCEGYMDVIALYQAGFKNAIATLGTAITLEQAQLIKRYADEIIICYDNDEAGQKATQRAISILRNAGMLIKVLNIPDGKDPDEFIKKHGENGPAAFKNLIANSGNDIDYQLEKLKLQFNISTPDGKSQYLNESLKFLAKIQNKIEQDVFLSKLCDEFNIDKPLMLEQLKKESKKNYRYEKKKEFKTIQESLTGEKNPMLQRGQKPSHSQKAEEYLLSYLIFNQDKADYIASRLESEMIKNYFYKRVYEYFIDKIKSNQNPMVTVSADFTDEESAVIAYLQSIYKEETATEAALLEYIDVILKENKKPSKDELAQASDIDLKDFVNKLKENKR